jgi:hypothetical protein
VCCAEPVQAADQAGLSVQDRSTLNDIGEILRGVFRSIVLHGFQHPQLLSIPRAPFTYTPPPLQPPQFGPLPVP